MAIEYILRDGTTVTKQQIRDAFLTGKAVLVHSRGVGRTVTCLRIDGIHYDTRGECYDMSNEAWTQKPATLREALAAARCKV